MQMKCIELMTTVLMMIDMSNNMNNAGSAQEGNLYVVDQDGCHCVLKNIFIGTGNGCVKVKKDTPEYSRAIELGRLRGIIVDDPECNNE